MTSETNNYLVLGYWNRQKELLEEARRLHMGAKAVRGAKAPARVTAKSERGVGSTVGDGARPPRAGSKISAQTCPPPTPVPAWRSAAARMGSSLVGLGERLERLAASSSEGR